MDTYRDDAYLVSSLTLDDPKFKTYYNFFGSDGCKAATYKEALLRPKMDDCLKVDKLRDAVYEIFKVGQKYSSKYVKEKLKEFHNEFGISATPKATDLEVYFYLKPVQIFTSGKRDRGFLILGEK